MKISDLSNYINYPALLDSASLAEADNLVETYPWYAGGQLLLARNLHNIKHIRFPKRLRIASISTTNRLLLRNFILEQNQLPESTKSLSSNETNTVKPINEQKNEELKNFQKAENIILEIADSVPIPTKIIAESFKLATDEANFKEEKITQIESLNFSFENEILNTKATIDKNQEEQSTKSLSVPFEPYLNFDFTSELLKLPPIERQEEKEIPKPDKGIAKLTFNDWLKTTKITENENPEKSLIDNFISVNPRISKPTQTEFFRPQDAARRSLTPPISFVTETLAKIYENQGHFEQAILAYENLSVKHPEKSSYFASRILNLKERIKN
jgi:hypothetical protein